MRPCLALALALIACDSLVPAPPAPDLRAAPSPRVTPSAPRIPPPDLAPPSLVEVELRGKVDAAGAPAGKLVVVITDGPCFQIGSHYIGSMPTRPGQKYFVEVFPPSGTHLDVCAALVVAGVRTTPWHGRAAKAPILAVGQGEVQLHDIDVKISKQQPVTLPDDLKIE